MIKYKRKLKKIEDHLAVSMRLKKKEIMHLRKPRIVVGELIQADSKEVHDGL